MTDNRAQGAHDALYGAVQGGSNIEEENKMAEKGNPKKGNPKKAAAHAADTEGHAVRGNPKKGNPKR